jgi:hypothetical protein
MKYQSQNNLKTVAPTSPHITEEALRSGAFLVVTDILQILASDKAISDHAKMKLQKLIESWYGLNQKRRGAPRNRTKRETWLHGLQLRSENPSKWSWAAITRKLDPAGHAADRSKATDRMRQGIEALKEEAEASRKRHLAAFYGN